MANPSFLRLPTSEALAVAGTQILAVLLIGAALAVFDVIPPIFAILAALGASVGALGEAFGISIRSRGFVGMLILGIVSLALGILFGLLFPPS